MSRAVHRKTKQRAGPAAHLRHFGLMIVAELAFNANRRDHKIENRLKDDGKRS